MNNVSSSIRTAIHKSYLPFGRLVYAAASGFSLLVATQFASDLTVVGEYVYQVGYASAAATVAGLGLDRILARRISSGELRLGFPQVVLKFRILLAILLVTLSIGIGIFIGQLAVFGSVAFFIVSRLFYADMEAVWVGAKLGDRSLFVALVTNGILTGAGIILGSFYSSAAMIAFSSLGNVIALGILLSRSRLPLSNALLPGLVRESQGISGSLLLAIVYGRVDLVILAAFGAPLPSVAFYGVVTRIFDALALVRGSLAQYEARDISSLRLRTKARRLRALSTRTQAIVFPASFCGVVILLGLEAAHVLLPFEATFIEMAMLFSAIPLFFSHLPTTTMIYSDRRTHRLLIGSVITCAGSVGIKWLLISVGNLAGAIFAIGLVELLSCLVFYLLYWENARSWASSRTVWLPSIAGILIAGISVVFT
ncbi:hypothetical protein [Arthrobacter sp. NyZ413]|uniref:hypothetical protein n=1 Tax=Arthrobacter sp. NyZ413 TaxID=3144669 RepID=UPI003BF803C0